jgi:dihydroorotase
MSNLNTSSKIELIQPDDWHLHIRDGAVMKDVLTDTARQFARAIIMPNLECRYWCMVK